MTIDTKASRKKMAKRTPGEWAYELDLYSEYTNDSVVFADSEDGALIASVERTADAEAICHAVNIHDALCDEIDELRAEVNKMRNSLRNVRRLAALDVEGDTRDHLLRFCAEAGIVATILRTQ